MRGRQDARAVGMRRGEAVFPHVPSAWGGGERRRTDVVPPLHEDGRLHDVRDVRKHRGSARRRAAAPVKLAHHVLPEHERHVAVNGRLKPPVDERGGAGDICPRPVRTNHPALKFLLSGDPTEISGKGGEQHDLAVGQLPTSAALARARPSRADSHGRLVETVAELLHAALDCRFRDRSHGARGAANQDAERGRVGAKARSKDGQVRAARQRAFTWYDPADPR